MFSLLFSGFTQSVALSCGLVTPFLKIFLNFSRIFQNQIFSTYIITDFWEMSSSVIK